MTLYAVFHPRNVAISTVFPTANVIVERFGFDVMGGPDQCELTLLGNKLDLFEAMNWLQSPMEIYDETGSPCWWGYLNEGTVRAGGAEFGASLDTMANRVAVAYESQANGVMTSQRATTAWAEYLDSMTEFGTKELLVSLNSATQTTAEARRAGQLAMSRYPLSVIRQASGEPGATMTGHGWYKTLGWRYYNNPAGAEEHSTTGIGTQEIGNIAAHTYGAQSFQAAAGTDTWNAVTVGLHVRKQLAPADNLVVTVRSDSGGAPGTVLATGTVAGTALDTMYGWATLTLNTPVSIVAGTTYWIHVSRSGALDATNYYVVDVDEGLGYTRGLFRLWNGSAWVARSKDADLLFRIGGTKETTAQIAAAIAKVGQFFTGTDIVDASGVYSSEYRDGDALASKVIGDLLLSGTSAGKRLLASVSLARRIAISVEPSKPASFDYFMRSDGKVVDTFDVILPAHVCPVGQWMAVKDVIAPTLDVTRLVDATVSFVERAEYVNGQGWQITQTRGAATPWDVGMGQQG